MSKEPRLRGWALREAIRYQPLLSYPRESVIREIAQTYPSMTTTAPYEDDDFSNDEIVVNDNFIPDVPSHMQRHNEELMQAIEMSNTNPSQFIPDREETMELANELESRRDRSGVSASGSFFPYAPFAAGTFGEDDDDDEMQRISYFDRLGNQQSTYVRKSLIRRLERRGKTYQQWYDKYVKKLHHGPDEQDPMDSFEAAGEFEDFQANLTDDQRKDLSDILNEIQMVNGNHWRPTPEDEQEAIQRFTQEASAQEEFRNYRNTLSDYQKQYLDGLALTSSQQSDRWGLAPSLQNRQQAMRHHRRELFIDRMRNQSLDNNQEQQNRNFAQAQRHRSEVDELSDLLENLYVTRQSQSQGGVQAAGYFDERDILWRLHKKADEMCNEAQRMLNICKENPAAINAPGFFTKLNQLHDEEESLHQEYKSYADGNDEQIPLWKLHETWLEEWLRIPGNERGVTFFI